MQMATMKRSRDRSSALGWGRHAVMPILLLGLLAGCAAVGSDPTAPHLSKGATLDADAVALWHVQDIAVDVPRTLSVSEDPTARFPATDIVWWEGPRGDRYNQVETIMKAAVARATSDLDGPVPVRVQVTVHKFHALTPTARRLGWFGWHDIAFDIRVTDGDGGLIVEEIGVAADLKAFQGALALQALANGHTQRSRISARVTAVIRAWMGQPAGSGPEQSDRAL